MRCASQEDAPASGLWLTVRCACSGGLEALFGKQKVHSVSIPMSSGQARCAHLSAGSVLRWRSRRCAGWQLAGWTWPDRGATCSCSYVSCYCGCGTTS